MQGVSEATQIDHETEAAEARWQALVARIDQQAAATFVTDQLMADLLTDGHPLCYALSHLSEYPPNLWDWEEVAASFTSLEAAALGKAVLRSMAYATVLYLADLSRED